MPDDTKKCRVHSKENVTEGTMSYEDHMTVDERRKYLHKMRIRYWQAQSKAELSQLLDEMEAVLGLHRKSLIRLIHGDLARKPRRKQRGKSYGVEVEQAVRRIAHSLDYPCAERLQPEATVCAGDEGDFEQFGHAIKAPLLILPHAARSAGECLPKSGDLNVLLQFDKIFR